jgi:putative cardiolipin synthase
VRVRVLLDDLSIVGRDTAIAQLTAHPNIDVRAFNPFRARGNRWSDFLSDPSRVNRNQDVRERQRGINKERRD